MRQWHARDVAWIERTLAADTAPALVLTHYAPLLRMCGRYEGARENSLFASSLDHLFRPPLVGWACGHTHQSLTVMANGVPCMSNCYGYPLEDAGHRHGICVDV
jgi:hypothetical protein